MYRLKQVPEDFVVEEMTNRKPSERGEYLYFWLTKRSYTTQRAAEQLAKFFHIPLKWAGYAGNKDKDAITTQLISLRHVPIQKAETLPLVDLKLKFFGRGSTPISLGELEGNRFTITIRNIDQRPELKKQFPNYFDGQRFSENNHVIGKLLVQKKFKEAVALISDERIAEARGKNPNSPITVLRNLPRKIWMLYINAYQSRLWNSMAAAYLKQYPHTTAPFSFGTLAFPKKSVKDKEIPIVGFGTEWRDKSLKTIGEQILDKEGITLRDFIIREFPELSSEGGERNLMVTPSHAKLGTLEQDELNPGKKKVMISFTLPKASYATMYVKSLFADELEDS